MFSRLSLALAASMLLFVNVSVAQTAAFRQLDFNGDGNIDKADLDMLCRNFQPKPGDHPPLDVPDERFDLDNSGHINQRDVAIWRRRAYIVNIDFQPNASVGGGYDFGDANVDGEVDDADLRSIIRNIDVPRATRYVWSEGDFDFDGKVTILDWLILEAHRTNKPRQ